MFRLLLRFAPRLSFPVFAALTLLVVTASDSASAAGTITTAQASMATKAGESGALAVIYPAQGTQWTMVGGAASYSATGASMNGTVTPGSGSSFTCAMTITLSNYAVPAAGYTVNGTQSWSLTIDSTTGVFTGTSTASLTLSGGPIGALTWEVSVSGTGGEGSLAITSGTVTCDGVTFDAKTL